VNARAALAMTAIMATACASRPSFQTESTAAFVASVRALERGPAASVEVPLMVPVSGVLVPIFVRTTRTSEQSYIYALRVGSEKIITTQSSRQFEMGDCVRLWHPPLAEGARPDYNFVAGTLERGYQCK
jgi:hypothetical protein